MDLNLSTACDSLPKIELLYIAMGFLCKGKELLPSQDRVLELMFPLHVCYFYHFWPRALPSWTQAIAGSWTWDWDLL